mgnify:CR=1 FL=1
MIQKNSSDFYSEIYLIELDFLEENKNKNPNFLFKMLEFKEEKIVKIKKFYFEKNQNLSETETETEFNLRKKISPNMRPRMNPMMILLVRLSFIC